MNCDSQPRVWHLRFSQPAAEKSIGTRERESAVARRAAHHLPKTRTPPESRGGVVSGTLMYGLWGDCWRAPLGEQMGAPEVPHGASASTSAAFSTTPPSRTP